MSNHEVIEAVAADESSVVQQYPTSSEVQSWLRSLSYSQHFNNMALEFADYQLLVRYSTSSDTTMLRQLFAGSSSSLSGDVLNIAANRLQGDVRTYISEHGGRDAMLMLINDEHEQNANKNNNNNSNENVVGGDGGLKQMLSRMGDMKLKDMKLDVDARTCVSKIHITRLLLMLMRVTVIVMMIGVCVCISTGERVKTLIDETLEIGMDNYRSPINMEVDELAWTFALALAVCIANVYTVLLTLHACHRCEYRDVCMTTIVTDALLLLLLLSNMNLLMSMASEAADVNDIRTTAYTSFMSTHRLAPEQQQ
jgi:hypothetical protein